MKSDLDRLMRESGIDAILVKGPAGHNPAMAYFTGPAHVSDGYLLKKIGHPPVLFHYTMERDEATRTGLPTKDLQGDYDILELIRKAEGDTNEAEAALLGAIFEEFELSGRVSLYGKVDIGPSLASANILRETLPQVDLVGEVPRLSVLTRARMTKDPQEVEHIRKVGEITAAVVGEVATFLTSQHAVGKILTTSEGKPLTVGEVKRHINLWLAIRGAENPEGTIFAIGHDSSVPHSSGKDRDPIELGKPIIFDIFPCEAGGGYFYDLTRTWCLGYAPDEVQELYEQVRQVYQTVRAAIRPGKLCREYQTLACHLFEAKGHPTLLSHPKTREGYVHSLGHGVGLAVHEGPSFSHLDTNDDLLQPGAVIAIEPGLYYPDRHIGVRIEDTAWVRPDGDLEILSDFSKDLVLKAPGW